MSPQSVLLLADGVIEWAPVALERQLSGESRISLDRQLLAASGQSASLSIRKTSDLPDPLDFP